MLRWFWGGGASSRRRRARKKNGFYSILPSAPRRRARPEQGLELAKINILAVALALLREHGSHFLPLHAEPNALRTSLSLLEVRLDSGVEQVASTDGVNMAASAAFGFLPEDASSSETLLRF